jgi:glycosyltransferase involved in cell wall biosynthesis
MCCYNASRWLPEAVRSVRAQSFPNFELIVVNDGSTDATSNIIGSHRAQEERIVVIEKENTGLTDSLNVGIARARGEWIARLDADDVCEHTRLERQVKFMRRHPEVVLVGSGFVEIDSQGRTITTHRYSSGRRTLVRNLERLQRFFPHSSAMFRRRTVQQAGGYNSMFRKTQDRELWLRLGERGAIACLQEPLVRIRKHPDQISQSAEGVPQLVYAAAASVCHFLRLNRHPDPSARPGEPTSRRFLEWVELRMRREGYLDARAAWAEARAEFFNADGGLTGTLRSCLHLARSGHAAPLAWEKAFGTSLPQRMAREWMERACAGS